MARHALQGLSPDKVVYRGGYLRGPGNQHPGRFLLGSRGGVFPAEEGLIEVVDAVVEGCDFGAHFLTEGVDAGIHAAFHGVNAGTKGVDPGIEGLCVMAHEPGKSNSNSQDCNDDLCCVAHADSLARSGDPCPPRCYGSSAPEKVWHRRNTDLFFSRKG